MRRNQLAKLTKHTELAYGWFGISFFHLRRVTELKSHANHFFLCFNQDSYGMAVDKIPLLFARGLPGVRREQDVQTLLCGGEYLRYKHRSDNCPVALGRDNGQRTPR